MVVDPNWPITRYGQDLALAIPSIRQTVAGFNVQIPTLNKAPAPLDFNVSRILSPEMFNAQAGQGDATIDTSAITQLSQNLAPGYQMQARGQYLINGTIPFNTQGISFDLWGSSYTQQLKFSPIFTFGGSAVDATMLGGTFIGTGNSLGEMFSYAGIWPATYARDSGHYNGSNGITASANSGLLRVFGTKFGNFSGVGINFDGIDSIVMGCQFNGPAAYGFPFQYADNGANFALINLPSTTARYWTGNHLWIGNLMNKSALGFQLVAPGSAVVALNEITADGQHGGYVIEPNASLFALNNIANCPQFGLKAGQLEAYALTFGNAWGTGIAYTAGQEVLQNNIRYRCQYAHVSGVFNTDLGNNYWIISPNMNRQGVMTVNNTIRNCGNGIGALINTTAYQRDEFFTGLIVKGNQIYDTVFDVLQIQRTKDAIIEDNIVERAGGIGLALVDFAGSIKGNKFRSVAGSGIIGWLNDETIIEDNYFFDAAISPAWITARPYVQGNRVSQGGAQYACLIAHTSGVFATDLAAGKWVVITDSWYPIYMSARDASVGAPTFAANPIENSLRNTLKFTSDAQSGELAYFDASYQHRILDNRTNSALTFRLNGGTLLKTGGNDFLYNTGANNFQIYEPWTAVTFAAGWSNLGSGFTTCQYTRDRDKRVNITGYAVGGTGTIFTLPAGYRPNPAVEFATPNVSDNTVCLIRINTDGTVVLQNGTATGVSVSIPPFKASQ